MNERFDEEYFAEIREKKLANLLAQEVLIYIYIYIFIYI